MPALLALLSSVMWGAADFLGGTLTRRAHAVAVVASSQVLSLVAVLPFAVLTGALGDPTGYLPWAVAAGTVGMVSLIAFYAALATGTMGVVAPIAATGVVVPIFLGLLGGDRPHVLQLVGILAAVAGVVLASGPELRGVETGQARGGARSLGLALFAAVGFGLVLWFLAKGGRYSVTMTLLTQRSASLVVAVVLLVTVRSVGGLTRRDVPLLAVIGLGDATANGLFTLASRSSLVSLVAVLGSLYPVGHRARGPVRARGAAAAGAERRRGLGAGRGRPDRVGRRVTGACDDRVRGLRPGRAVPARLPARAGAAHPGVVHAAGRPLAAGVPRACATASAMLEACRRPTWSPRSRCSRCAATASTRRSSSPTSWCRCTAVGVDLDIVPGIGPVIAAPVRDRRRRRPRCAPLDAGRRSSRSPRPSGCWSPSSAATPLIGFAGAPFTLASYLVEGGPSREPRAHQGADVRRPGALARPAATGWRGSPATFLRVQVEAGVGAVQLFDSWVGALSRGRLPRVRAAALGRGARRGRRDLGVPRIHFGVGTGELLGAMGEAGADVVGVDWRVPLDEAAAPRRAGLRAAGQPRPGRAVRAVATVLEDRGARGARRRRARLPGHVFNLGHGVLPETDPDALTHVVDLVHAAQPVTGPAGGRPHVVVVGGGIPGLAAAHALLERAPGPLRRHGARGVARRRRQARARPRSPGSSSTPGPSRCWPADPRRSASLHAVGLGDDVVHPAVTGARRCGRGGSLRPLPTGS